MPPEDHDRDRPQGVTTWLVIPYFVGDVGRKNVERPLPPGKGADWWCPSIFVDGKPGNTAFRRGVPLRVSLAVANWGAGTVPAVALVRLWWTEPTLAFPTSAVPIGQTSIVVPPGGAPVQTGHFTVTIPVGASPHVCLLAQVSAPVDGASSVPDPHSDRHWGQLNLVEVAASAAAQGTVVLPVLLANPFAAPRRSAVAIEPMAREDADRLGHLQGRDIRSDADVAAQVRDADGADASLADLQPYETRSVEVTLRIADPAVVAHGFVLTQRLAAEGEETTLTGTLGVLVAPD